MGSLSAADRRAYTLLRNSRILDDVEAHRLDLTKGVILHACADGDQSFDLFTHLTKVVTVQRTDPRIHWFGDNGGALILPTNSPFNVNRRGENRLEEMQEAHDLKGICTVALYSHAPCGKVGGSMNLTAQVNHLVRAKIQVKERFSWAHVACFFHMDLGEGNKHTYFVSRKNWEEYYLIKPDHKRDRPET